MAMLDRFQGLFKKKAGDEPDLSNATDQDVAELAAARLAPNASSDGFVGSPMVDDEDEDDGPGYEVVNGVAVVPVVGALMAEHSELMVRMMLTRIFAAFRGGKTAKGAV